MEGRSSINQRSMTIPLLNLLKMRSISLKGVRLTRVVLSSFFLRLRCPYPSVSERERGTISFSPLPFTREKMRSTNDRRNHYRLEEGRGVLLRERERRKSVRREGVLPQRALMHSFHLLTLTDTHFTTYRYNIFEEILG